MALALHIRAENVYYITSTFTECFPVASASDTLSPDSARPVNPIMTLTPQPAEVDPSNPVYPPKPGYPPNPVLPPLPPVDSDNSDGLQPLGVVTYSMPPCAICDCPTCTTASVFTTLLPGFGPSGLTERPYIITETYVGMSSLPYFPTPTPIPYGFTAAVATCTDCGAQPITGTVVRPKTGRSWGQDMAAATGGLGAQPSGAPPPKSGAYLPPDISGATYGLASHPSSAPFPKSGPDLTTGAVTTSNRVGAVETTFSTSTEHIAEKTPAGDQDSEVWDGEVRTSDTAATSTSYIQVSAAESPWRDFSLSYGVVILSFWVLVLPQ